MSKKPDSGEPAHLSRGRAARADRTRMLPKRQNPGDYKDPEYPFKYVKEKF